MNGTGSNRPKPRKDVLLEFDAEKALWKHLPGIQMRLIYVDAEDLTVDCPNDILILRLESPQDDPEVLEEYPDSVVVWQTIRMDAFDVAKLIGALKDWMNEG